jgi:hypothetical protein
VAKPQYSTDTHRAMVAQCRAIVDSGHGWCTEPICLMPTRYIPPGSPVDAAHDGPDAYRGPAHPKCNRSEGGKRGNRSAMRRPGRRAFTRWAL